MPSQIYLDILGDLTFVEKAFIACAYLVMSIIKLRSSRIGSTTFYHWIWGHTVILPQNSEPLVKILPLNNLVPYNVICIA